MSYIVYTVTGEYSDRQAEANRLHCDLYFEQHVNSSVSESPDHGLSVVATNASDKSKEIGMWYAAQAGKRFDVGGPLDRDIGYGTGLRVGGRGNNNIYKTKMPAVLLEPWFASNPKQARKMIENTGVQAGAQLLLDTILKFLPEGGKIALSIGHMGQPSRPSDRGAPIVNNGGWEADWSRAVIDQVAIHMSRDVPSDTRLLSNPVSDPRLKRIRADTESARNILNSVLIQIAKLEEEQQ